MTINNIIKLAQDKFVSLERIRMNDNLMTELSHSVTSLDLLVII